MQSQSRVDKVLQDFRDKPELEPFFRDARAILVVPSNFRAGTGFGGAVGKGWLLEEGKVTDSVWHWQLFAGADMGFQFYRQILFFRDEAALASFRSGSFQFAGQANATALLWGKGWTPSYNPDVAVFTEIDGGLMIEGSIGLHSYHLSPVD